MQSFYIGAVKGKNERFPQTAPTDVAVKSVDGSQSSRELENLQKGRTDRTWHRFGAGLGGSDTFVSQSLFGLNSLFCIFLVLQSLFMPENRRENNFLYLLVRPRSLLGSVRSEDTW